MHHAVELRSCDFLCRRFERAGEGEQGREGEWGEREREVRAEGRSKCSRRYKSDESVVLYGCRIAIGYDGTLFFLCVIPSPFFCV